MNIAFDAAAILGPMSKHRGIGNYAYSQFKTMIQLDQKNTYYFFNVFEQFSMKDAVGKGNIVDIWFFTGKNHELISDEEYKEIYGDLVKTFLRKNQIDLFYITSPFDLGLTTYQKEWFDGVKTVATVYDIIPYVMKKKYLPDQVTYRRYMECVHMLRWVDAYLVISQSVKNDMISYLKFPKEKIHVIYGAADSKIYRQIHMTKQETDALFDKFQIQGNYIMCTGGDDDRKNIEGLIRAYSRLQKELLERYQLIIVCRLSRQAAEKYSFLIQQLHLKGRVIFTNFVPVQDLVRLYNQADLMAFPSLYEGFGLPVLEAWMCGTPVLTSDNSSLGEIGKDAAVLVKAECISDITKGLNYALTEADLEKLRRNAEKKLTVFNWETTARAALSVLSSFRVREAPASESSEIKKIAMFTPLPPIQSGISDYSADLISELEPEFEIDVYIDKYKAEFEERERVHIYPAKAFAKKQKMYDRIIYQVGNSLYHAYMFPYIKKYPGIVVLHDCDLKNVLEAMYLYKSDQPRKFIQNMLEDYDQTAVDTYMRQLNTAYTLNFEINGFVVNYAEKIIVHSQYAKKRLLSGNIGRQVQVIPLYAVIEHDHTVKHSGKKSGDGKECFVFAVFGHIHETKRVIPALTAFAHLCRQQPDRKLMFYFVGKMAKELEGRFREKVREYGLHERVYVTGYVSMKKFSEYLDMADVCVNLRYPYHGESSASFMRALAKGKCVIVNRIGSFCEIPEDACMMIRNAAGMSAGEEVEEIYQAMRLSMNESFRADIQNGAKRYAKDYLDLKKVGRQYVQAIKEKRKRNGLNEEMLKKFAVKYVRNYTADEIKNMAITMAYTISS